MSMLLIEIPLAILAFRRGWRRAPAGLLALPFLVLAFESGIAALLLPIVDGYFDPAGTARALSHGSALVGLLIMAFMDPSEAADHRACDGPRQTAPHGAPLPDLTICQIPGPVIDSPPFRRRQPWRSVSVTPSTTRTTTCTRRRRP